MQNENIPWKQHVVRYALYLHATYIRELYKTDPRSPVLNLTVVILTAWIELYNLHLQSSKGLDLTNSRLRMIDLPKTDRHEFIHRRWTYV